MNRPMSWKAKTAVPNKQDEESNIMEGKTQITRNSGRVNRLNLFAVCVDSIDNGELSGRLYHCFAEEPFHFVDVTRLLIEMDSIFDYLQFPQASTQIRSFKQTKALSLETRPGEDWMEMKELLEQKGKQGTFLIRVQFRQNTTWQGSLVWGEKQYTQQFRSALELLRLMDDALNNPEPKN